MNQTKKYLCVLVIICQFLLIGYIIVRNEYHLKNSKTIVLKLQPVDPRSLMQGDYVVLNYSKSQFTGKPFPSGSIVYTELKFLPEKGYHEMIATHLSPHNINNQENLIIRGKVSRSYLESNSENLYSGEIEYGIENYFTEENTGKELETTMKYAKVKVSSEGDAMLVELMTGPPEKF